MKSYKRLITATVASLLTFTSPLVTASLAHADSPARGSATVGTVAYVAPVGALYVNPVSGNDTNSGTIATPFKTVAAALTAAASGATIVLRGGVYHESVTTNKSVTIQNYPYEAVWFDGSVPLTSWTKSGSTWVKSGWTKEFSSLMGGDAAYKARFVSSDYPMAANADQVFLSGVQLTQVGSSSAVVAGTFYVDNAGDKIVIGSDPTGKEIRASDLALAMKLSGNDSVLRGIGVRNYANGYEVKGAVQVNGTGGTVQNIVVQDTATIGLSVSGANKTIDQVTVTRAGMLGIGGNLNDNSVVQNSIASDNDYQNFKPEPVSGGMKFTSARTFLLKNNEANSNHRGTGVWFDVSCYNITMVNNTANSNLKYGLEAEISSNGIIANNEAINNTEAGIILFDAGNFKIFNNEVGGGKLFGIKLAQDQRRQADGKYLEGRDPRYKNQVDPTITWLTENVTLSNNVFGNKGYFQLYALDGRSNRAADTWNLTITGNLFNKRITKATDPTMVAWGKGDNVTLERYEVPETLSAAKNSSWVNAQIPGSKRIEDMDVDKTTYQSYAVPLPQDVADAIGQPAGSQHLGNF